MQKARRHLGRFDDDPTVAWPVPEGQAFFVTIRNRPDVLLFANFHFVVAQFAYPYLEKRYSRWLLSLGQTYQEGSEL